MRLPPSGCLRAGVTARTFAWGRGFNAEGALHAHAWLVAGGEIIVGDGQRHTVTALPLLDQR